MHIVYITLLTFQVSSIKSYNMTVTPLPVCKTYHPPFYLPCDIHIYICTYVLKPLSRNKKKSMWRKQAIAPLEKCVWKGGYWVNVYVGNIQSHHNDVDLLSFPWFFTTIQQSRDDATTVERWILFLISNFNIQYPLISISIDQLDFTDI